MQLLENVLVSIGKEKLKNPSENAVHVIEVNKDAQNLIDDLQNYPHAYVLACMMDRQIKANKAWELPYKIKSILKTFEINDLANVSQNEYIEIFNKEKLHRFCTDMAVVFSNAVQKIFYDYKGDASKIWLNKPSSAKVVYNFLQFNGCGIKIATMAANILTRQYGIQYSDYKSIDISPDVHVRRTMMRLKLIPSNIKLSNGKYDTNTLNDMLIYRAREIYPDYPGIIDYTLWDIGRKYCHPENPECDCCELKLYCPKCID